MKAFFLESIDKKPMLKVNYVPIFFYYFGEIIHIYFLQIVTKTAILFTKENLYKFKKIFIKSDSSLCKQNIKESVCTVPLLR